MSMSQDTNKGPWEGLSAVGEARLEVDRAAVQHAASILFADGDHHELRALPSKKSRLVNRERAVDGAVRVTEGARGIYYTLNPVLASLGDRAAKDGDVLRRRWIMVDVDPVKPDAHADDSATDGEKEQAGLVATRIVDDLRGRGWPAPVTIDSGNGYHLLYRVDLPNDDASKSLVKRVLKVLANAHDNAAARVDQKVFNAARIAKLPGTWARKGAHSIDRPHRLCMLDTVPEPVRMVAEDLLRSFVGNEAETLTATTPTPLDDQARDCDVE
jgi:hypothetical protein